MISAFLGVVAIYAVAKPRLKFGTNFGLSVRPDGSHAYRVKVKPKWPALQVTTLTVITHFSVTRYGRGTSIPVPLSRSEWYGVRSSRKPGVWPATPRLRLDQVKWRAHLPRDLAPPSQNDLGTIFDELNATLYVTVIASSAVFGVTTVDRRSYTRANFHTELEPYSDRNSQNVATHPRTIQGDEQADESPPPPAHPAH